MLGTMQGQQWTKELNGKTREIDISDHSGAVFYVRLVFPRGVYQLIL